MDQHEALPDGGRAATVSAAAPPAAAGVSASPGASAGGAAADAGARPPRARPQGDDVLASAPGDRRVREAVVAGFAWTVGVAGVAWGSIYLMLDLPWASAFPFAFTVATAANALAYRRLRHVVAFAGVQVVLILITPVGLAVYLGGFLESGAVALWSALAPLGAMMLLGPRAATVLFALFVAAVLGLVFGDTSAGRGLLPELAADLFTVLNVLGVVGVAFWLLRTFVATNAERERQQRELRRLEQAYLAQELLMRQQERLATLGKLSAGVAHELNNPAAAAGRASAELARVIERVEDEAARLLAVGASPQGLLRVGAVAMGGPPADALERSDRVDELAAFLSGPLGDDAFEVAETLVAFGADRPRLESATAGFDDDVLDASVRWIADTRQMRVLLDQVRASTGRVSEIVRALKGYSHMDRSALSRVDLVRGLEDTLVILRSQLTGVEVRREFEPGLAEVQGNAGELNQVWTNLIANAADALRGSGTVTVRARSVPDGVRVEVEDDGPGIPSHLVDHVFDPFVTTKPPGEGTGLGLNLAHRTVVDGHGGTISVTSRPGCTRFVVTLPAQPGARHAGG